MFGNAKGVEQRHSQMDGFKRSFSRMTKADFTRVINDVREYMMQKPSFFLTDTLGDRCDRYK